MPGPYVNGAEIVARPSRWAKRHRVIVRRAKVVKTSFMAIAISLGRTDGWQWRCTAEECIEYNSIEQLQWHRTKTHAGAISAAHCHIKRVHGRPRYLDRYKEPPKGIGHGYAQGTSSLTQVPGRASELPVPEPDAGVDRREHRGRLSTGRA